MFEHEGSLERNTLGGSPTVYPGSGFNDIPYHVQYLRSVMKTLRFSAQIIDSPWFGDCQVCPGLSLPLILRILANFVPDVFSPDPISPALLNALSTEVSVDMYRLLPRV